MSNDTPNFRGHFPITLRRTKHNRKVQKWRYPRGIDRHMSKKKGPQPKIGYGHDNEDKFKHPCGLKEVLVRSQTDLLKLTTNDVAIRFSGTLGQKKKLELTKLAKEKKFKIIN
ncbi:MAG: eL32 family ribosomal protein [archaeon]|jgi:large subunit ribosomal protein L32e